MNIDQYPNDYGFVEIAGINALYNKVDSENMKFFN